MSIKSKLLTTAAVVTFAAGMAHAEKHSSMNTEAEGQEYAQGWNADLDQRYSDIADQQVAELIGMNVVTESGNDVGEVDNFILDGDRLMAVVGVGGFLGLGEHEVALPLDELQYNGEALVIAYTEEELEAMPEYTEQMASMALNESDTFRMRGTVEDGDERMAGAQLETTEEGTDGMGATGGELAASTSGESGMTQDESEQMAEGSAEGVSDEQTIQGEMADNTIDSIDKMEDEQTAENAAAEGEQAMEEAGEEVAQAAEATEDAAENAAAETEQMAENAAAEGEQAMEEAGEEVAQAAEATENAAENAAAETEQMAENAAAEGEQAMEEAGEEVAQAAEATENAAENAAAETEQMAENAAATAGSWMEKLENEFADIASWEVNEVEGTAIVNANGEVIGEVEDLARQGETIVALVGVGGFLGLGEHDVALDLNELGWNGESFVVEGHSKEDLEAMPEYDSESVEMLDDDVTLQSLSTM